MRLLTIGLAGIEVHTEFGKLIGCDSDLRGKLFQLKKIQGNLNSP